MINSNVIINDIIKNLQHNLRINNKKIIKFIINKSTKYTIFIHKIKSLYFQLGINLR